MDKKNAIEVRDMSKSFKIEYDKAHTLKDMILFWRHSKPETIGIMTVFNEELNIGKCIESIQDYVDSIIVFDDASTDHTIEIASKYKKVKK